jgi:hypothetical protein
MMGLPNYVKCPNPKCQKLNPVAGGEAEQGREYTCVFCGRLFTVPEKAAMVDKESPSKKRDRGKRFPPMRSAGKPVNRNTTKPLI